MSGDWLMEEQHPRKEGRLKTPEEVKRERRTENSRKRRKDKAKRFNDYKIRRGREGREGGCSRAAVCAGSRSLAPVVAVAATTTTALVDEMG